MTSDTTTLDPKQTGNPTTTQRIMLAHGGGGQLTDDLIRDIIKPRFDNPILNAFDDSAIVSLKSAQLAFSTDSYVVQPLEFPGGDIGRLAVSGTINDLAVCGADPIGLSLGLILEEGLDLSTLERILDSIAQTSKEAGVPIITGDTKVVAHGQADGMYITTSGIGLVRPRRTLNLERIQPGDQVLINGPIADHGLAVMLQRESDGAFQSELKSDVAPLNTLIGRLLDEVQGVVFMRDPTRGGLAGVVDDLANDTGLHLTLDESTIAVRPETHYAADMLGLDPLDVANEGKVIIVVRANKVSQALRVMREHPLGRDAAVIGEFGDQNDGLCEIITEVGGRRIIQKPYGEQLPRIC